MNIRPKSNTAYRACSIPGSTVTHYLILLNNTAYGSYVYR